MAKRMPLPRICGWKIWKCGFASYWFLVWFWLWNFPTVVWPWSLPVSTDGPDEWPDDLLQWASGGKFQQISGSLGRGKGGESAEPEISPAGQALWGRKLLLSSPPWFFQNLCRSRQPHLGYRKDRREKTWSFKSARCPVISRLCSKCRGGKIEVSYICLFILRHYWHNILFFQVYKVMIWHV